MIESFISSLLLVMLKLSLLIIETSAKLFILTKIFRCTYWLTYHQYGRFYAIAGIQRGRTCYLS